MAARPLVAVPTYHLVDGRVRGWVSGGFGLPERYVESLQRAGARTVLVPALDGADDVDVLDHFDALILAGGGDVSPARFGAAVHPAVYGVDTDRDSLELEAARRVAASGMPTLAICRGLQVVNVAFGGTLFPHLPDVEGMVPHGSPVGGTSAVHDVKAAGGSQLEAVCGSVVRDCISHHHQGVDRLGDGLVATAWSEDGLVEALEPADRRGFFVAVQWHPEMSAAQDKVQQALFDALVAAARG